MGQHMEFHKNQRISVFPAVPVTAASVQRQSIYMRSDTIRTPSKQLGTPVKVLKPKTPATMTVRFIFDD
jgi:hypothetical protein